MLAGLLAGAGATIANLLVAAIARALFQVPADFRPFMALPILAASLGGSLGAAGIFGVLERLTRNVHRSLALVALAALLLSFYLPASLFDRTSPDLSAIGWDIRVTLMLMHIIVAWLSVRTLIRLRPTGA